MENLSIIKEFVRLTQSFKLSNEDFSNKYKTSSAGYNLQSGLKTFSSDDIKEIVIIYFIGFTVLHFLVSISVESVSFFSMNWFIFYLVLSFVFPLIKKYYDAYQDSKISEECKEVNLKYYSLKDYFEANQYTIDDYFEANSNSFSEETSYYEYFINEYKARERFTEIYVENLTKRMDENHSKIDELYSKRFNIDR
jgi:hypothetical protein